jgi:hypothetical protein
MEVTFLSAAMPLVKTFSSGSWSSYPNAKNFTSIPHTVSTLADFHELIARHAAAGHCLLKGTTTRELNNEPRAGSTTSDAPTQWFVLDFDGVDYASVPHALNELGLSDYGHIIQYSASAGIKPGLRAHVFFMLEAPVRPQELKQWITHLNLTVPRLLAATELTASGVALKWPLDITVNQNDKLIYIAPPTLDIPDPTPRRLQLVNTKTPAVPTSAVYGSYSEDTSMRHDDITKDAKEARIMELRRAKGLYKKLEKTGTRFNQEICTNPDEAQVTGIKRGDDFTYLNLNGGDSWGYFYKTLEPKLLHNFKGEPAYALRDIAPEHYREAKEHAKHTNAQLRQAQQDTLKEIANRPINEEPENPEEPQAFFFQDRPTGQYYTAAYYPAQGRLELHPRKSRTNMIDSVKFHTGIKPDEIPEAIVVTDFHAPLRFMDGGLPCFNRYQPTKYRRDTQRATTMPPMIEQMLRHIHNYDDDSYEHFINWIAYIWQTHDRSGTAWILQGTEGTGKGIFVRDVLSPLFGREYIKPIQITSLENDNNSWAEQSLFVIIEESNMESTRNKHRVVEKLKNLIGDSYIEVNEKYQMGRTSRSFLNCIAHANNYTSMGVSEKDRRFNVAPRQEVMLKEAMDIEVLLAALPYELQHFADYLTGYQVNVPKATIETLQNEAKTQLQETMIDAPRELVKHLLVGDYDYFDSLRSHRVPPSMEEVDFRRVLDRMLGCLRAGEPYRATRDDLMALFVYAVGWKEPSPNKFSSALKRYGLHLKRMRVGGELHMAVEVQLHASEEALAAPVEKPKVVSIR